MMTTKGGALCIIIVSFLCLGIGIVEDVYFSPVSSESKSKESIMTLGELKRAINRVVEYCWDDELHDYEANQDDEGHIFHKLVALDQFVHEHKQTADDFVKEKREE